MNKVNVGDTVFFRDTKLAEKYGEGPHEVLKVDKYTQGVQIKGLSACTFDPDDFIGVKESTTSDRQVLDPALTSLIQQVRDALPSPKRDPSEAGFRPTSFYRFPVVGCCWCGKPLRETLDGRRCEDEHKQ